jgi:hypothetical protein
MSLTYQNYAGHNSITDCDQIAIDRYKNKNLKIYYCEDQLDILTEHDEPLDIISEMVDDATSALQVLNIGSNKLNDLDCEVLAGNCPNEKKQRRIYNEVKDSIAALESKIYHPIKADIMVIPRNIPSQNERIYVSGSSGSRKSTWVGIYATYYLAENPGGRVYLVSRKTYDKAFDGIVPGLIRIPLNRQFIKDMQQKDGDPLDKYENSLIIFDDFESISDPALKKAIFHFKDSCFQLGRSHDISVCSIQHKALGGNKSMVDICEANIFVFFPRNNLRESKAMISRYCGFEKDQMERIFTREFQQQRWAAIIRPDVLITKDYIKVIN